MSSKPSKCPACSSDQVARIVFGYPSEKMIEAAQRGEVLSGGCLVTEDDPNWHCKNLGSTPLTMEY